MQKKGRLRLCEVWSMQKLWTQGDCAVPTRARKREAGDLAQSLPAKQGGCRGLSTVLSGRIAGRGGLGTVRVQSRGVTARVQMRMLRGLSSENDMPKASKASSKRGSAAAPRASVVSRSKAKPRGAAKAQPKAPSKKTISGRKAPKSAASKSSAASSKSKSAPSKSSAASSKSKSAASTMSTSELLAKLAEAKKSAGTPAPGKPPANPTASYQHYLKLAQALPKDQLVPFRLDPQLALFNVRAGVASLLPSFAQLKTALPLLNFELLKDLPALCQALIVASTQVMGPQRSDGEVSALLAEARTLRSLLLSVAAALVLGGHLPGQAVDKIRAGSGFIDLARDCVELAALYRKHPDCLQQQKLVDATQLDRAAEIGAELLDRLKPSGSRSTPARSDGDAVEARDRLASLLVACHRDLRRAGYWLWADQVDAHVPYLQARKVVRGKPKPAPASPPIPPPTNP
jgi:hypothetical protein